MSKSQGHRYRYTISSTGHSSRRYGACTVCGEHVSEVFYQVEERRFHLSLRWLFFDDLYGHEACLMDSRR